MKGIHRLEQKTIQRWLKSPRSDEPRRKLPDGGGLNLVKLSPGSASWQVRYRLRRVEKTYTIGPCTVVSLAEAREEHARVRAQLRAGQGPIQQRLLARAVEAAAAGEMFSAVTDQWLEKQRAEWGGYHFDKSSKALGRHVLPRMGNLPVRDIPPALVADVIDVIQRNAGRDTAAKILRHVRAIFRYAAAKGLRVDNPADAVVEILVTADKVRHRPAILTAGGVRGVLATLAAAPISAPVLMCHQLIAYTAVRISNAVSARWEEFDLEAGVWSIPRDKMKMQDREHAHRVLLAPSLIGKLRSHFENAGRPADGFLFPGQQGRKHVSRETVEKALLENGYRDKHTCHGWRASFSTLAKESGLFEPEVVDLALDHVHDSEVARAYDRGERLEKRVKLMAWWGALLSG